MLKYKKHCSLVRYEALESIVMTGKISNRRFRHRTDTIKMDGFSHQHKGMSLIELIQMPRTDLWRDMDVCAI